ncbi:hypothetical protein [Pseudomonas psychrophila]|uniref:hypothetical protein n=1 Tax=Pseudomonas psychrophila TaxID=122355 RepID=UPI00035FD277|nr:hypothetical protein [Pseudomonas psychrophila]
MKVLCEINNVFKITEPCIFKHILKYIRRSDGETDLDIGKIYTVYGVEFRDNYPWFYLCTEDGSEYPKPYASAFFNVLDSRLSKSWFLNNAMDRSGKFYTSLVIYEWAEDCFFHERLIDGESKPVEIFKNARRVMDAEYEI